jgi:hypothetical protein
MYLPSLRLEKSVNAFGICLEVWAILAPYEQRINGLNDLRWCVGVLIRDMFSVHTWLCCTGHGLTDVYHIGIRTVQSAVKQLSWDARGWSKHAIDS